MRCGLAGLLVSLTLCLAGTARGQAPAPASPQPAAAADVLGRRVVAVRILLDGLPAADADLPQLLDIVVGQPLDPGQVRSSIEHLVHLRRFASVDVLAEPAPDGIVVRVELASARRIGDIRIDGPLRPYGGAISRAARERLGSGALAAQAPAAVAAAQDVLGARGYLRPQLTTRLEATGRREVVTLVVTGEPGPRWQVGRVTVAGLPAEAQAAALAGVGLESGMPYDRDEVDTRVRRYTERLRAAGYYEAVVRTTPVPGQGDTTIDVTIDVARGPLVSLAFEGDPLP
jgi:outer membrane protein assembly factor BamA